MESVEKIFSVSVDMFCKYGFKTITMDDIARRAGISKKTLYQHFETKGDVVLAGMKWFQDQICDKCDDLSQDADNAVEAFVRIIGYIESIFRQINPLAILELERYFPDAYGEFRKHQLSRNIKSISDNIKQGIEEGYYREGLNADLIARFRIETCMSFIQPNSLTTGAYNIQQVNQEISELFLYGLMTAKGERLYKKYKEKYLQEVVTL